MAKEPAQQENPEFANLPQVVAVNVSKARPATHADVFDALDVNLLVALMNLPQGEDGEFDPRPVLDAYSRIPQTPQRLENFEQVSKVICWYGDKDKPGCYVFTKLCGPTIEDLIRLGKMTDSSAPEAARNEGEKSPPSVNKSKGRAGRRLANEVGQARRPSVITE